MTDNPKDAERLAALKQKYWGLQGDMPPFGDVIMLIRLLDARDATITRLQQSLTDSARLSAEREEWWTATLAAADSTIAALREERDAETRRAKSQTDFYRWYTRVTELEEERDNLQKALADITAEGAGLVRAYSAACEDRNKFFALAADVICERDVARKEVERLMNVINGDRPAIEAIQAALTAGEGR